MKLLLFSALLLALSTLTADGAAVYDVSGNALKPGARYYITSAIRGAGGGGLFPIMRPRICPKCRWCCPLNVAQKSSDLDKGHSVFVSPSDSSEKVVNLLTDVKIEFTGHIPDGGSPIWKIDRAGSDGFRYVTLNGNPNNAINEDNLFKIAKDDVFGYRLLYCPPEAQGNCGNLGRNSDGNRWLFLSPTPFGVVFVKA